MTSSRRLLPALAAVAAVLLLASCGSDGTERTTTGGPGSTSTSIDGPIGKGSNGFGDPDGSTSSDGSSSPGSPGDGSTGDPGSTDPAPPDPGSSASIEPGPDDPSTQPGRVATEVANRHDLIDPRAVEPESLVVDPKDDRRVHVRFWGGVEACYGAEASVAETAEAVVVTLRTGGVPGGDEACIDLAVYQQLTLTLDAPLGDRTLDATPAG